MVGTQNDTAVSARPEWSAPIDDPAAGTWFLAATKINMERRAAQDFAARSIDYYLPLRDEVAIRNGSRRVVQSLTFSRYIFVRGTEFTPSEALAGRRLMNVLPIKDQDLFRRQLRGIELAIEMNPRVNVCPYAIKGNIVRIKSGPLVNREAVVLDRKERTDQVLVILEVKILGQGIEVQVDAAQLEPA